jgi:hypothetical protein
MNFIQQNILYTVAQGGHLDVARLLFARGIEIEIAHLDAAASSGSPELFDAILACSVEPGRRSSPDDDGDDATIFCARATASQCFGELLDADQIKPLRERLLEQLVKQRHRRDDIVERVCEQLVLIGASHPVLSPLHLVVNRGEGANSYDERTDAALTTALLDAGHDIDTPFPYAGIDCGATPMMRAAACGRRSLVELLLSRGANARACDARGMGAAAWASRAGDPTLADLLVSAGAERQRWAEPAPHFEPITTPVDEPEIDLVTKIGCFGLALAGAIGLFFWALIKWG